MTHIDTAKDRSIRLPGAPVHEILVRIRRILSDHRIGRMRRRMQRELDSLPGIVRRDVGLAETVHIKKHERSHQFYSLD